MEDRLRKLADQFAIYAMRPEIINQINQYVVDARGLVGKAYQLTKTSGGLVQNLPGMFGAFGKFLGAYTGMMKTFNQQITGDSLSEAIEFVEKMKSAITPTLGISGITDDQVRNRVLEFLSAGELALKKAHQLYITSV